MGFLFSKKKKDIKTLYVAKSDDGCLTSNRITVDGAKVGYMYRETPSPNFPDSGWRFFAGDESEEYTSDHKNFNVFKLNTVCNYDHDIIPFLDAPYGSAFIRDNGRFVEDEQPFEES